MANLVWVDKLTELTFGEDGGVILGGELPNVGVSSRSTEAAEEQSVDPRRTSFTKGTNI